MKNNVSLLWNPFTRIAGWQAFWVGLAVAVIAAYLASCGKLAFDGVLDAHFVDTLPFAESLLMLCINLVSISAVMYFAALILTSNFRFQDILGTFTLSRAPYLLLAAISLFVSYPSAEEIIANPLIVVSNPSFLLFILLSAPILVWQVALMYHAFRVSLGVSGSKSVVVFIAGILVAEIVSKVLIYFIHRVL